MNYSILNRNHSIESQSQREQESNRAIQSYYKRLLPWLLNAEDKKPPKGFEKFFKKRDDVKKQSGKILNHLTSYRK